MHLEREREREREREKAKGEFFWKRTSWYWTFLRLRIKKKYLVSKNLDSMQKRSSWLVDIFKGTWVKTPLSLIFTYISKHQVLPNLSWIWGYNLRGLKFLFKFLQSTQPLRPKRLLTKIEYIPISLTFYLQNWAQHAWRSISLSWLF